MRTTLCRRVTSINTFVEDAPSMWPSTCPRPSLFLELRNKEFWGDQGAENDVLEVNGTNVIGPETHPISRFVNATFIFDKGADGVSHLGVPIAPFSSISFLTGVDLYIPGENPPKATVSVVLIPRDGEHVETINIPNWASDTNTVTLQFDDYNQNINSWAEYVNSKLE